MKSRENKAKSVSIRLTDEENEIIDGLAYMTGQTKSDFIRQLLRITINATKINQDTMNKLLAINNGSENVSENS